MFSSGRFENWKSAINIISKKPIIGYGAQSDRIYIKQSIHNSILYTTLSGGLISGISLVLIYLYTVYLLFNFFIFLTLKSLMERLKYMQAQVFL